MGEMKIDLLVVLVLYLALQVFKYALEYLNVRHMRLLASSVPPELEGAVDRTSLEKMQAYVAEKTAFDIIASGAAGLATIVFLFGGLLDRYNSWIASLNLGFIASGPVFFLLLYVAGELLSVPFSLYSVFRIENRHGFNTMSAGLWLADFLKGMMLSLILLIVLSLAGFLLIQWSPRFWWFWVWCAFLALTIFITYISPYVIEPLFNTFIPVEDGDLKDRIIRLASSAGINVSKVLKMDQSKRSRHMNAYFAGIGRTKRIILFDTLLGSMSPDEIVAVLAHEIGHWKRRHLLKGLAITQALSLLLLFCAYRALQGPILSVLFRMKVDTLPVKMVAVAFLASMLAFFLKPAMNGLSRSFEREADRFSCDLLGKPETMVNALAKLSKENLSNLFPHPLYALFNYSHPPVLERIRYIRAYGNARKEEGRT